MNIASEDWDQACKFCPKHKNPHDKIHTKSNMYNSKQSHNSKLSATHAHERSPEEVICIHVVYKNNIKLTEYSKTYMRRIGKSQVQLFYQRELSDDVCGELHW